MFTLLVVTFAVSLFVSKQVSVSLGITAMVYLASTFGLFTVIFGGL